MTLEYNLTIIADSLCTRHRIRYRPCLRRFKGSVLPHNGTLIYSELSIIDAMGEKRLGDVIDDHCIKCRRITNHSIVSLLDGEAAKVRCRTCYHDHDYRREQAPPTKKELKKMEADALAAAEAAAGKVDGEASAEDPAPPALTVDGNVALKVESGA